MSIVIKDADEIITCVKDVLSTSPFPLGLYLPNKKINQYLFVFTQVIADLTVGMTGFDHPAYDPGNWEDAKKNEDPLSLKTHKNLKWLSGKTINCSPADFETALEKYIKQSGKGMASMTKFVAAVTEKMTLSIRLNLEQGPFLDYPQVLAQDLFTDAGNTTALADTLMWDLKTLYYRAEGGEVPYTMYHWLTIQLASADKDYDALDWEKLIEDAKEGEADWTLDSLFEKAEKKAMAEDVDLVPLEKLFIQLLQTPEFDAITQSILLPATIFNTIQTIPNAEIGFVLIKMMRQRGAFKGMDEALDAWLSLVKNYLFGDFPWMTDCSLKGII